MQVPGAMLLRDPKGYIYAIQTESMQQIDLSDDQVILLLFAQGDWGEPMHPCHGCQCATPPWHA